MLSYLIPLAGATLRNRKAVTAAEYAILAVTLVGAILLAVAAFGPALAARFQAILR